MDQLKTNDDLIGKVGPSQTRMPEPTDYRLITRVYKEETWISGIYLENTFHVTHHHPADCLHAIVNIGDVPPHPGKAIRIKIYNFL